MSTAGERMLSDTMSAQVGRPFPKGVSGNPGGRPKGLAKQVQEMAGGDSRKFVRILIDIAEDESIDTKLRLDAVKELLDRGWGKSTQMVATDDEMGGRPIIIMQSAFKERPPGVDENWRVIDRGQVEAWADEGYPVSQPKPLAELEAGEEGSDPLTVPQDWTDGD